jgi:hypothetical protein
MVYKKTVQASFDIGSEVVDGNPEKLCAINASKLSLLPDLANPGRIGSVSLVGHRRSNSKKKS